MTAYWSDSEEFTFNKTLIPKQGQWLDPIALFSNKTVDSQQTVDLSSEGKRIRIIFKSTDGAVHPADSKIIWPYACTPVRLNSNYLEGAGLRRGFLDAGLAVLLTVWFEDLFLLLAP